MKRSLTTIAMHRPVTVLMLVITVLALGGIAWRRIPIEFLPKFDFPFIICVIPYPGATPQQVENEVAIPAEGEFRTISQLRRISTTSDSDGCTVHLAFDFGSDMALAAADVRDRMERLRLQMPTGVDRMVIQRWSSDSLPVVFLTLYGDEDYEDLSHMARTVVKSRLTRLDGVADVQVFGKPEQEVLIEFDQNELISRNLSLYQVVSSLQDASFNMSVGELTDGGAKYYVRVLAEYRDPAEIADLVVGPNATRLGHVADVGYRSRELEQDYDIDGHEGVVIMVRKEAEANTVAVCAGVVEELETLHGEPEFEGIESFIIFNQADIITMALEALLDAGRWGGLLAIAVLYVFLQRIRPTLLVALAIPASVVVALVYMFFAGMTLNLITMISLIVAFGMLVDNSIVVIENIYRYNQLGLDPRESARRGASEVGLAITAATMTTVVVFLPITFLEAGEMSTYMKQFGMPITVSLLASLVIALTVIPLAASRMRELNPDIAGHPLLVRLRRILRAVLGNRVYGALASLRRLHPIQRIIDLYVLALGWVMRRRLATCILLAGLIALTVMIPYQHVGRKDMPNADSRQISVRLKFDQTMDMEMIRSRMELLQARLNDLREDLGVKTVFSSFGGEGGDLAIFLKQKDEYPEGQGPPYTTEQVRDALWKLLPDAIPGGELEFGIADADESNSAIELFIRGDDSETLAQYARDLRDRLSANIPQILEATTEEERAREEIQIQVDEVLAADVGVTPIAIAQTVDFSLRGIRLPYIKQGSREVPVWAQFREEDRKTRANLDNVGVLTQSGELAPVSRLVDYTRARSPRAITRVNGKNVTVVRVESLPSDLDTVVEGIKRVVAGFRLPRGYTIDLGDRIEGLDKDLRNFLLAFALSATLIYLVMGALFESFILPLSILWSVPLAFIGVYWMLYLTETSLDPVAFIGMILMTGIVVNNGIVIIDHINQLRLGGMNRYDAVLHAGRDRFRPVMMTALTTILGCVPISFGTLLGTDATFEGLGRALIGGLTTGTLLTLLIVPLVYSAIDDMREWVSCFLANLAALKPGSLSGSGRTPV